MSLILQRHRPPSQTFADINLNLAGPLPDSNGYSYILQGVSELFQILKILLNKN